MKAKTLFTAILLIGLHASAWANHSSLRSDTFNANPVNASGQMTASTPAQIREFADHEIPNYLAAYSGPFVSSGGVHATSGSFISAAFATTAFVPEHILQTSQAIDYENDAGAIANDVCWTIISSDTDGIAGWSRVGSTAYYVNCQGSTTPAQPSLPANSAWLMQIQITSSAISIVTDLRVTGILMPEPGNAHGTTDLLSEYLLREDDHHAPYILSGCTPAVPGSGLTLAAFACTAYVSDSTDGLRYVSQSAVAVTIADATPTWLAIHKDTYSTVAGWTRSGTSHYLYQNSATQPATPDGAIIFARITVATPNISAVESLYPVNQFSATNLQDELRQELGAGHSQYVYSGCQPAVPGASLTIAAFACTAFVADGSTPPILNPVVQTSLGLTVPDSATVCLGITTDRMTGSNDPGTYTGVSGTHYVYQAAACTSIAATANVLQFAEVTVAGSIITNIIPFAYRSPQDAAMGVHTVTNWGATGDGSTDYTTAIQNAFYAPCVTGRGTVVIPPPGTYYLNNGYLIADCDNVTILLPTGATLLKGDSGAVIDVGSVDTSVSNVSIIGKGVITPDTIPHDVSSAGIIVGRAGGTVDHLHIDVNIIDMGQYGIASGSTSATITNFSLEGGLQISADPTGAWSSGASVSQAFDFNLPSGTSPTGTIGASLFKVTDDGTVQTDCFKWTNFSGSIVGARFVGGYVSVLQVTTATDFLIQGIYLEKSQNSGIGLGVGGTSSRGTITGVNAKTTTTTVPMFYYSGTAIPTDIHVDHFFTNGTIETVASTVASGCSFRNIKANGLDLSNATSFDNGTLNDIDLSGAMNIPGDGNTIRDFFVDMGTTAVDCVTVTGDNNFVLDGTCRDNGAQQGVSVAGDANIIDRITGDTVGNVVEIASGTSNIVGFTTVYNSTAAVSDSGTSSVLPVQSQTALTGSTTIAVGSNPTNKTTVIFSALTGATTITNITGAKDGDTVTLINTDASFNVVLNRDNAVLDGGTNQTLGQDDSVTVELHGSTWYQVGSMASNS